MPSPARGSDCAPPRHTWYAVADREVLFFRFDACGIDALHAVGTLFHDPAAAHGDFGIAQELELRRLPILEAQEVEAAHFVRAVVRAVAHPDTAVVDHVVQAFGAVHRGAHRANLLAGSVLALLTRNGLKECLRIVERFVVAGGIVRPGCRLVITVDANPVHFAAAHHLLLSYHGDIVFRLACDYARVAAITAIEIDDHGPLVAVVGKLRLSFIERQFLGREFGMLVGKIRILAILLERGGRKDLSAFYVEVILRAGKRVIVTGFLDRAAGSADAPKRI